jgi:hypothetical protein
MLRRLEDKIPAISCGVSRVLGLCDQMSRIKSFSLQSLKKVVLIAVPSLVIAFGLAEIVLRLFVVQETKRLAIYDSELGWRGRPNGSGLYVRKKDGISVPFRYNELGFRDDPVQPRSAVSTRLVLLGDSFAENLELPLELTYPALLKRSLRKDIDPRADVVVLGSQGYSTAQELLALRKFGPGLKPDFVLLTVYTGNDFDDNTRSEFALLDGQGTLVLPENRDSRLRRASLSFKRWLYESSDLVFAVKNQIESLTAVRIQDAAKVAGEQSEGYKYEITGKLILETRREAERLGAGFAVAVFTSKFDLYEHAMRKTEFVEEVCRTSGVHCLTFKDLQHDRHFFPVDVHFNLEGHQFVAGRLAGFLQPLLK